MINAPITFSDLDPASVESTVLTAYETIAGATLYPGDPVRLFLESLAYIVALQNNVIDMAGKQNLLAFAQDAHLDEIGKMVGTPRLSASCARLTQRFNLAAPLDFAVTIPAGTRITTADARRVFTTQADAVIPAGALFVETTAQAAEQGAALNGLVPGQVNKLIDPLPYITATANVTPSGLGADVESDARFRDRIRQAPERYTCAGPSGSYKALALAAHQDVADVAIWSPKPGTVDVRPVLQGGELPGDEVLAAVRNALSADDVRPLTDTVIVAAPEAVEYEISVAWSLARSSEALAASTEKAVAAAVEQFRLWQRSQPGRDLNPTRLISLMEKAGARRVEVTSPTYTVLHARQIARETRVNVRFLGIEDE